MTLARVDIREGGEEEKKRIVFFFTYYATAESKLNSPTIDVTATATTYGLSHNEITAAAAAVTVCESIWQRS